MSKDQMVIDNWHDFYLYILNDRSQSIEDWQWLSAWQVCNNKFTKYFFLLISGSDLNSSSKPWETQFKTSKLVYAEFHEQGDVEKLLGWKPIPLFDRDNYAEVASMQVSWEKVKSYPLNNLTD